MNISQERPTTRVEYMNLPDGQIAYELSGTDDGPLVVAVHGLGDLRQTYRLLTPALTSAGFRVAAMDVRGYGDSSADWPDYSTMATAGDITALIRHLGGPAVIIGHSFAAGSAGHVAIAHPELVSKIIMVGPNVRQTPLNPFMKLAAKLICSNATLWAMYYKSLYPVAKPDDFSQYLADLKASLRRPGRMKAVSRLMASFADDAAADLTAIDIPVLIVMGEKDADHSDPAAEANRIASELGGPATVELITGSGHYPHVDAPDVTNRAVTSFLAEG